MGVGALVREREQESKPEKETESVDESKRKGGGGRKLKKGGRCNSYITSNVCVCVCDTVSVCGCMFF